MKFHFCTGDCEMSVCGGVSSIITPETFIPLCRARMMSAVGQCQTFCDTADGYARGEGCGMVILKKLSKVHKTYRGSFMSAHVLFNLLNKLNELVKSDKM